MKRPEDLVLAHLLARFEGALADRVRACLEEAHKRGTSFVETLTAARLLSAEDAQAYSEAARYLTGGQHVFACPRCRIQVIAPASGACAQCHQSLVRGVLPTPQSTVFDPGLERHVRRMILDASARERTRGQVNEANRLRSEGRIGKRPEAELAPADASCRETTLGNYTLQSLLGRGGSSYVYKAEDHRNGQTCALKVLYFQPGEPEASVREKLARFRREAELASKLDHPNLVGVGALEQVGSWYHIPMTLVEGPSLAQLLEARAAGTATDLGALIAALGDVARGLHYAHCQGVIHRDVNPRNILFSAAGQAALGDFGVARPLEAAGGLTGQKVVLGLIGYAAPERLVSEAKADVRSDVYSLGVVLYEILTGRLPFTDTHAAQLLPKIQRGDFPAPRALAPDVPAALETVAMRALSRDPAQRHASALEFAQALAEAVAPDAGAGVQERGAAGPAAALGRGWRAAAMAFIGFGFGVAAAGFTPGDRPDPARAAEARVASAFRSLEGAREAGAYTAARTACEEALRHASADVPALALGFWRGRLHEERGEVAEASREYELAVGGAQRNDALLRFGLLQFFAGERHGAGELAAQHRNSASRAFDLLARERSETWDGRFALGMLAVLGGDGDSAIAAFHELARTQADLVEPALMEAWVALRHGAPATAGPILETLVPRAPFHPWVRFAAAIARLESGQAGRTAELLEPARTLWPAAVESRLLLARVRLAAGDPAGAEKLLDEAEHRDARTAEIHRLRARAAAERGDLCRAIAAASRVLTLVPGDLGALYQRGMLECRHGDRAAGDADLRAFLTQEPAGERADRARQELAGK